MIESLFYSLAILFFIYECIHYFKYNQVELYTNTINITSKEFPSNASAEIRRNYIIEHKKVYLRAFFEFFYWIWIIIGLVISPFKTAFLGYFVYTLISSSVRHKIFNKGKYKLFSIYALFDLIITMFFLGWIIYQHLFIIFPFL